MGAIETVRKQRAVRVEGGGQRKGQRKEGDGEREEVHAAEPPVEMCREERWLGVAIGGDYIHLHGPRRSEFYEYLRVQMGEQQYAGTLRHVSQYE